MTRKRWLVTAGVAAWVVLLLALGVWSAQAGPATVREQSQLVEGRQAIDRAVEVLRVEASAQDLSVDLGPYEVSTGCRLSLLWRGTEVDREVVLHTSPGAGPDALAELRPALPSEWNARFNPNTGRLSADAGDFVQVIGVPADSGEVRITLSTGCRPGDDPQLTP